MTFILIGLIVAAIYFLLKPHHLQKSKYINKPVSRRTIVLVTLASLCLTMLTFGTVMAATEPASVKQARMAEEAAKLKAQEDEEKAAKEKAAAAAAEAQRKREEEAKKPVVKNLTETKSVPFKTVTQKDGTLPKGQTEVAVEGVNGVRKVTYQVTFVQGKEVSRKLLKNAVIVSPTMKVVKVGTYIEPAPQTTPSGGGDGYVNSRGNYVPSPSSNPAGATAKCSDGTYSYSQSRRGTCSHHGGVAIWY